MIDTVRPIRDSADHQAALAEIERLWGSAHGTAEGDRLDLLMTLVDGYERAQWEDDALDPIDAIKARMENSGRTRKDFEKIVGSSGRVSEILSRKRRLTLPMIWLLVDEWKMPASALVRPYKLSKRKPVSARVRSRPLAKRKLAKRARHAA